MVLYKYSQDWHFTIVIYGDDLASKINLSHPVALAAVRSKSVVLLLLIQYLLLLPLFCVLFLLWSLFCCAVPSVVSSFAILSLGKVELIALL